MVNLHKVKPKRTVTLLVHPGMLPIAPSLDRLPRPADHLLVETRRCDLLEVPPYFVFSGRLHCPPALPKEPYRVLIEKCVFLSVEIRRNLTAGQWLDAEAAWIGKAICAAEASRLEQAHRIRWLMNQVRRLDGHVVIQNGPIYRPVLTALRSRFGEILRQEPPPEQVPIVDSPYMAVIRSACEEDGALASLSRLRQLARAGLVFSLFHNGVPSADRHAWLGAQERLARAVRNLSWGAYEAFWMTPRDAVH